MQVELIFFELVVSFFLAIIALYVFCRCGLAEWTIIELQGVLESDGDCPLAGKMMGNLVWDTVSGIPLLIIGRHLLQVRLGLTTRNPRSPPPLASPIAIAVTVTGWDPDFQGKCSQLEKPLLVLAKSLPVDGGDDHRGDDVNTHEQGQRPSPSLTIKAVVRRKLVFKQRPKPIVTVKSTAK